MLAIAYITCENQEAGPDRLKRIRKSAPRNEQPMSQVPTGATTNPCDLSIAHNHGSPALSESDGMPSHAESDATKTFEEINLNNDAEVTRGADGIEDTDAAADRNWRNVQNVYNDLRWGDDTQSQTLFAPPTEQANEKDHQASAEHIAIAVPDSQEFIAPLAPITSADPPSASAELFEAIEMMASSFPGVDTHFPDASDPTLVSFATGADMDLNAIDIYSFIST